jgi:hypothetical protein
MSNLEQEVRADLSLEQACTHMTFLVEQVGERLAGTQEIDRSRSIPALDDQTDSGAQSHLGHHPRCDGTSGINDQTRKETHGVNNHAL